MQGKLQELSDKLYQEGVEKAKQESDRLLAEAREEAGRIREQAKKEAAAIKEEAEKQAAELKRNVESEIQLAGQQAVSALKQQISELIVAKSVEPPLEQAMNELDFFKQLIETVLKNWKPNSEGQASLSLLLPKDKQDALHKYLDSAAFKKLAAGVEVSFEGGREGGFKIGPKEEGFLVSFTEEGFKNFFKEYLRPRAGKYLFGGN